MHDLHCLIVARNVLTGEVKYFIANRAVRCPRRRWPPGRPIWPRKTKICGSGPAPQTTLPDVANVPGQLPRSPHIRTDMKLAERSWPLCIPSRLRMWNSSRASRRPKQSANNPRKATNFLPNAAICFNVILTILRE